MRPSASMYVFVFLDVPVYGGTHGFARLRTNLNRGEDRPGGSQAISIIALLNKQLLRPPLPEEPPYSQ
ncbi:unnamed protein product [Nippostrongylus brasiliensis]|uniref:Secreted protein n=1 Tax=Nippostrongylus brasiliensis TaxID=27835 RepID=A0A0N4YIC8_NIPBR|nr:unnamed protein product [Nippostrongylus brasiliensis]